MNLNTLTIFNIFWEVTTTTFEAIMELPKKIRWLPCTSDDQWLRYAGLWLRCTWIITWNFSLLYRQAKGEFSVLCVSSSSNTNWWFILIIVIRGSSRTMLAPILDYRAPVWSWFQNQAGRQQQTLTDSYMGKCVGSSNIITTTIPWQQRNTPEKVLWNAWGLFAEEHDTIGNIQSCLRLSALSLNWPVYHIQQQYRLSV